MRECQNGFPVGTAVCFGDDILFEHTFLMKTVGGGDLKARYGVSGSGGDGL